MDIRPIGNTVQLGTTGQSAPLQSAPLPAPEVTSPTTSGVALVTPATQDTAAAQTEPSLGQVQKAVQKINTSLASQSQGIEFSIDSSSHRIVVKVVDQSNNQVIRQIPSKEALAIADSLDQSSTQGLLIKQQA